jgi:hypothetical protein
MLPPSPPEPLLGLAGGGVEKIEYLKGQLEML